MSAYDVVVGADGTVFVAAEGGKVVRLDGTSTTILRRSGSPLQGLWLSPSGTLWGVGDACYAMGDRAKKHTLELDDLMCVWGTADDDLWVGGYGSRVGHFDGERWSYEDTGLPHRSTHYIGGLAGDGSVVIACGEKGAAFRNDGGWSVLELPNGCLNDVVVLPSGGSAMCGQDTDEEMLIFVGSRGSSRFPAPDDEEALYRMAVGPDEALFVATSRALVRVTADGCADAVVCEECECNAVGSNGARVATVTSAGVHVLDDDRWTTWSLD